MTLLRKRIVSKTVKATAHAPARKHGTAGAKPLLSAQLLAVLAKERENHHGAQEVIHRYMGKVKNPMTAIRAKCVDCSGGSLKEVAECRVVTCALHPFRMGVNPYNKKTRARLEREELDESDDSEDADE